MNRMEFINLIERQQSLIWLPLTRLWNCIFILQVGAFLLPVHNSSRKGRSPMMSSKNRKILSPPPLSSAVISANTALSEKKRRDLGPRPEPPLPLIINHLSLFWWNKFIALLVNLLLLTKGAGWFICLWHWDFMKLIHDWSLLTADWMIAIYWPCNFTVSPYPSQCLLSSSEGSFGMENINLPQLSCGD
jgi:hypothetical protein